MVIVGPTTNAVAVFVTDMYAVGTGLKQTVSIYMEQGYGTWDLML